MKPTIICKMMDPGQVVCKLSLPWEDILPEKNEISVTGDFTSDPAWKYIRETRELAAGDVTAVTLQDGMLTIEVVPFSYRAQFQLQVQETILAKGDFEEVETEGEERFAYLEEGDVLYRLYSPQANGPRPLILFLHGGGNGGTLENRDNRKHILADFGPINFADFYPDVYIMAPQAIEEPFDPAVMGARLKNLTFATSATNPNFGWSRRYLGEVCDIIRRMIREGKVDEKRIYVTGLSMGGGGTLKAMSVGSDLFAACVPVCPTMTPETFNILRTMKQPVWVSTAYVDHFIYRHKYITDAILQLKDAGHKNAHLTLYSPEELAKYDIGIGEDIPYEQLVRINHASWVPTYHNEYGIMSWLLNQSR